MRCADGHYYVVKFTNNPQGLRILANDLLGSLLANFLGLPVSPPAVIEVSDWLVEHSPELYIHWGNRKHRCTNGFQFGSRFPCDPLRSPVYDFLPDSLFRKVMNQELIAGMLVFDKWTGNSDTRKLIYHRSHPEEDAGFRATMIDQGHCFNGDHWDFPDHPACGFCPRTDVYAQVHGLDSFEPFLTRLKNLDEDFLEEAAASVPPEWYEGKTDELRLLMDNLDCRRQVVEELLVKSSQSAKNYFPGWEK